MREKAQELLREVRAAIRERAEKGRQPGVMMIILECVLVQAIVVGMLDD